jgi:hypothetical protein
MNGRNRQNWFFFARFPYKKTHDINLHDVISDLACRTELAGITFIHPVCQPYLTPETLD